MSVGESVTIGAGVPEFTFIQFVCSGRDTPTKSPSRHINNGAHTGYARASRVPGGYEPEM